MTAQARLLGGRYQVGELLGYGGMAEVHRGRDLRLGRDVAIKMLRTDLARDATFQERFRREAQNSAALNHPAIVAVYDTGEEISPAGEKQPFIVMEFVNGQTLKEVLAQEQRLQPRRALEIIADICAALEFSHRHGIIHRDIKPGNVMLTQTGQVKVMDFGIARALASGASTMTQTSAVIGTAQYLSPEQARGEAVDARSDVYATGCVVYELLIGQPPFVGDNPVSVAYQHVREDPKAPSASNRDVSPDIDAIVLKALAKNPLNRYQSAAEMRADLLRAANGRPVLATPVMTDNPATMVVTPPPMGPGGRQTGPARVGNPQRRRASAWVLVALSLLGLIAVVALGVGLYLTGRNQTTTVPKVVGLSQNAAIQALQGANLKVGTPKSLSSDDCTVGNVLSSNPTTGANVDVDTPVILTVCSGPNTQTVPQLTGEDKDTALATLKSLGFTNVTPVTVDGPGKADTVLSISPDKSTPIPLDTQITVKISRGNEAKVPSLDNDTQSEATAELRNAGFTHYRFVTGTSHSESDVNHVIDQDPNSGDTVKQSAMITVTLGGSYTPASPPKNPPPHSPPPSAPPSSAPPSDPPPSGHGHGGVLN